MYAALGREQGLAAGPPSGHLRPSDAPSRCLQSRQSPIHGARGGGVKMHCANGDESKNEKGTGIGAALGGARVHRATRVVDRPAVMSQAGTSVAAAGDKRAAEGERQLKTAKTAPSPWVTLGGGEREFSSANTALWMSQLRCLLAGTR